MGGESILKKRKKNSLFFFQIFAVCRGLVEFTPYFLFMCPNIEQIPFDFAVEQENAKKYMTIVVRRMVSIIESNPISGDAFPMRDFENNFKFVYHCIRTLHHFRSNIISRNINFSQCHKVWIAGYRNRTFSFGIHRQIRVGPINLIITSKSYHRHCCEYRRSVYSNKCWDDDLTFHFGFPLQRRVLSLPVLSSHLSRPCTIRDII